MKTITQTGEAKFEITTANVPNSEINLDFNPLIQLFNLTGSFLLVHWQSKPKGCREWGIYSSDTDNYHSCSKIDFNFARITTLQLDDKTSNTVPSSVLYYPEGKICLLGRKIILGELLLDSFNL